jgi:phospholipid/cholesterol/gamma-HCH transport system ATP-binding protein
MNDHPVRPGEIGVSVDVRGLHKSFHGTAVLQGIDLAVHAGDIFVIMGPSGSGKSVLLRHLIGLAVPDAGEILIGGRPVLSPGLMSEVRMAMVFQSGALLNSLTVGENVGLYLTEHRLMRPAEVARFVAEKLEVVGLKGQENRLPSELSGGMRKRVAIARALIVEPQLILYDEPTSELDPLSSVMVAQEIVRLQRRSGVTSVVVSHDRELAFGIADRIAFIHEGRIRAVGTPAEIRAVSDPAVAEFLTADFKFHPTQSTV